MTSTSTVTEVDRYAPVGSVVRSGYWGDTFEVLSHNSDGSVTVVWVTGPDAGVTRTHYTRFEYPRYEGDIRADVVLPACLPTSLDVCAASSFSCTPPSL